MTATSIARHEVKDFDAWMEMFKGGAEIKKGLGVIAESVHRDLDNPNMVTVINQFADAATARAFVDALKSERFRKAGDYLDSVLTRLTFEQAQALLDALRRSGVERAGQAAPAMNR